MLLLQQICLRQINISVNKTSKGAKKLSAQNGIVLQKLTVVKPVK
jgi:hypothetical protein